MATHGKKGSVYRRVAPTTFVKVGETTAWTLNVPQAVAEAAVHEEDYMVRAPGVKDWNVDIEGLAYVGAARTDENVVPLMVPSLATSIASGEMYVRLRNNAGTAYVYEGEGYFTNLTVAAPAGDMSTFSASLVGNGALTYAAP